MLASLLRLSPAIPDFTSVVIWLSAAASSVLVPAFWSSAAGLLGAGGIVESALFTGSTLLATVSAAGFSLVSAADPLRVSVPLVATALVPAFAGCRLRAAFGSAADAVEVSALLVATRSL